MKKMILVAAAAAMTLGVQAEFKTNPDANTLWSESGSSANITKEWRLQKGKLEAGPDKANFDIVVVNKSGSDFGRYVPVSSDYPWMVVKVQKVSGGKGYFAFSNGFLGGTNGLAMGVSRVFPGTYVGKINLKDPAKKSLFLRNDFYGESLTLSYMGMQKVPEVMPEFTNKELKKGDEMTLVVTLQKPAEELSLKLFKRYTMPQIKLNGRKSFELTPNADKKVWTLKVPFQKIEGFDKDKKVKANEIIFALEITRGDDVEKVYTNNPFEIQHQ